MFPQASITNVSFVLLVLLGLYLLYRFDRGLSKFRFVQFFQDDKGRADKWALVLLGSFAVSSWGLWRLIETEKLQEWYWNGYLYAFVIAALGRGAMKTWEGIHKQAGPDKERKDNDTH